MDEEFKKAVESIQKWSASEYGKKFMQNYQLEQEQKQKRELSHELLVIQNNSYLKYRLKKALGE